MKRWALIACMALSLSAAGLAQEHEPAAATEHEGNLEMWKWANFAILAGLLGWLIAKNAPPFFRARTEEIQRGIAEATKLRSEAEARAAAMEARMAKLGSEIEHLRADSTAEMTKEAERLRQETEKQLARIQTQGEQEIEAASKRAQKELRAYSAQLAVQMAEQRIRGRMSADTQHGLVAGFIRQLDRQRDGARQ